MISPWRGFLIPLVCWGFGAGCAEAREPEGTIAEATLAGLGDLTVTRVAPDGSITLAASDSIDPRWRNVGQYYTEGYYLLPAEAAPPGGKLRLFRVRVDEVADLTVTIKVGDLASPPLRVKDRASLVRPPARDDRLVPLAGGRDPLRA